MHGIGQMATLLALSAMCSLLGAQSASKEFNNLKKELQQVSKDASKYSTQLNQTMKSLEGVKTADPKNLPKAYKNFQKDANNLDKSFKSATNGMKDMRAKRDQYFAAWEKSSASISTPELRQASEERRQKVVGEHTKMTEDAHALREQIDGFMGKLGDLEKFLGSDLSPDAVKAATPTIDGVLTDGRSVAASVGGLSGKLSGFANGL